jgi:hypothetical protein
MSASTHNKRPSQKLLEELQLARVRLAKVKGALVSAKEQARLAKRRRKEAKEVARRAKKQARLAKKEVLEAELILAEAESRVARPPKPARRTRVIKRKIAKVPVATRKKKMTRRVATRMPSPAKAPVLKVVKPKRSKTRLSKPRVSTPPTRPKISKRPIQKKTLPKKPPIAVPREFEPLAPPSISPAGQASVQPDHGEAGATEGDETKTQGPAEPPGQASPE